MANQLKAVVTADIRQFASSMNAVGATSLAASTAAVAAFAAVTASLIKLDKSAIDAAKSYETLGLAFQFSYENAAIANKEFASLVKFADATPFDTEQLARYSIQLRNVTSGFIGATEDIKLMSGALAKAQLLGKDKQFVNSLGRIITAFQTGSGQIKRYTQTLLNTGAITTDTAIKIKSLSEAGAGATEVWKVLTAEFNRSRFAAYQFSQTAAGLESTLGSKKTLTLGSLAGEEGLEGYKLILGEVNTLLTSIRETEAFKELGDSFSLLNAEILSLIKSDDFKVFLLDVLVITRHIVNAISAIVKGISVMQTSLRIVSGATTLGISEVVRAGIGADSIFTGNADIATMKASAAGEQTELIRELVRPTKITANGINPEKQPEVD